jgi:predicted nucleic acid-binding protein
LADIHAFLSAYVIVPLRESIGNKGYDLLKTYSRSHGLQVFDSLIAATAMEEGLTLITRNRKHYHMIEGLRLEVPEY